MSVITEEGLPGLNAKHTTEGTTTYGRPNTDAQIKVEVIGESNGSDLVSLAETFANSYMNSRRRISDKAIADFFFSIGGMSLLVNKRDGDLNGLRVVVEDGSDIVVKTLEEFVAHSSARVEQGLFKFLGELAQQRLEKGSLCPPKEYSKKQDEESDKEFRNLLTSIFQLRKQAESASFYKLRGEISDKLMLSSCMTFDLAVLVYQELCSTQPAPASQKNIPDATSDLHRSEPEIIKDPRHEAAKKLLSIVPNTANMPTEEVKDLLLDTRCVYINPDAGASLEDIKSYRQLTREAVLSTLKYRRDKEQYGPETLNTLFEIDTESNAAGLVLRVLSSEDLGGIFEEFERYCEGIKFGLQSAKEHPSYVNESYIKAILMLRNNPLAKRFLDRIEVLRKHNPYQVHTLQ